MRRKHIHTLYPDEIFIDSENLPGFDTSQMEGRIEKPISRRTFLFSMVLFVLIAVGFAVRLVDLQIVRGAYFGERSLNNKLRAEVIPADRGVVYDRNGTRLAWNGVNSREYAPVDGLSHIIGYIGLPSEYDITNATSSIPLDEYIGKVGVEHDKDRTLRGERGSRLTELDSLGNVISKSTQKVPRHGTDVTLTIDSALQSAMYGEIGSVSKAHGWEGGAGIIMDVRNGDVLAITSYPEFNSKVLSSGAPRKTINGYLTDPHKPFLNRALSGLYSPGSIIKPLIALSALEEHTIDQYKKIFSSGRLVVENPYDKNRPSIFKDWKAHGWVDMRRALAVSSNVYFYTIGGGFGDVAGVGIRKLNQYFSKFNLDKKTGIDIEGESIGTIPNPETKKRFEGDSAVWRVGDTYNSSIGQGYFQLTPIQIAVYVAAVANGGNIVQPTIYADSDNKILKHINIKEEYFKIVREGMREAVTDGTARAVSVPWVQVAAKTGTVEVDASHRFAHSWVIGFFPYDEPRYAFAVLLERGPSGTLIGAPAVMRGVLRWMHMHTPEYFAGVQSGLSDLGE